ncbi:unnamed protein product [Amoebophrya sp. A25]|nr:unnamed protein product [Amoebophrya sp. A25]|eukprot:GSA25T00014077001.1
MASKLWDVFPLVPPDGNWMTPSMRAGVAESWKEERSFRYRGCRFIERFLSHLDLDLKMVQSLAATAFFYFQLFHAFIPFGREDLGVTALACVFLACKVGEHTRKIRPLMNAYNAELASGAQNRVASDRDGDTGSETLCNADEESAIREQVHKIEFFLLRAMHFHLEMPAAEGHFMLEIYCNRLICLFGGAGEFDIIEGEAALRERERQERQEDKDGHDDEQDEHKEHDDGHHDSDSTLMHVELKDGVGARWEEYRPPVWEKRSDTTILPVRTMQNTLKKMLRSKGDPSGTSTANSNTMNGVPFDDDRVLSEIRKTAGNFYTDAFRTWIVLRYMPFKIAAAALFMSIIFRCQKHPEWCEKLLEWATADTDEKLNGDSDRRKQKDLQMAEDHESSTRKKGGATLTARTLSPSKPSASSPARSTRSAEAQPPLKNVVYDLIAVLEPSLTWTEVNEIQEEIVAMLFARSHKSAEVLKKPMLKRKSSSSTAQTSSRMQTQSTATIASSPDRIMKKTTTAATSGTSGAGTSLLMNLGVPRPNIPQLKNVPNNGPSSLPNNVPMQHQLAALQNEVEQQRLPREQQGGATSSSRRKFNSTNPGASGAAVNVMNLSTTPGGASINMNLDLPPPPAPPPPLAKKLPSASKRQAAHVDMDPRKNKRPRIELGQLRELEAVREENPNRPTRRRVDVVEEEEKVSDPRSRSAFPELKSVKNFVPAIVGSCPATPEPAERGGREEDNLPVVVDAFTAESTLRLPIESQNGTIITSVREVVDHSSEEHYETFPMASTAGPVVIEETGNDDHNIHEIVEEEFNPEAEDPLGLLGGGGERATGRGRDGAHPIIESCRYLPGVVHDAPASSSSWQQEHSARQADEHQNQSPSSRQQEHSARQAAEYQNQSPSSRQQHCAREAAEHQNQSPSSRQQEHSARQVDEHQNQSPSSHQRRIGHPAQQQEAEQPLERSSRSRPSRSSLSSTSRTSSSSTPSSSKSRFSRSLLSPEKG